MGSKNALPLDEFLCINANRLNQFRITSLMMPLAIFIRDKHLRGELSLKLSPKYIKVTEKGCVYDEKQKDDGFAQQLFLSPEQLKHTTAGIYSDIYAFCAVLDYMISKVPVSESTDADISPWKAVVAKGLMPEPADRYGSMQDLIYALAPYNSGITKESFTTAAPSRHENAVASVFASASGKTAVLTVMEEISVDPPEAAPSRTDEARFSEGDGVPPASPMKRVRQKRSWVFKAGVAAAALVLVVILYAAVNYIGARISISHGNFKTADTFLNLFVFDDQIFSHDRAYVNAGLDLENQKYDLAIMEFTVLGSRYDAQEFVKEGKYEKAAFEASVDRYGTAVALYEELGDYKDSASLMTETKYQQAAFEADNDRYDAAIALYEELGDYKDSASLMTETKYQQAAFEADNDRYDVAISLYEELGDYKDSTNLINETICRKGYYLIETKKYAIAIKTFETLKEKNYLGYEDLIHDANYECACTLLEDEKFLSAYDYLKETAGYKDSDEMLSETIEKIYKKGIDLYHQEQYLSASTYFNKVDGYERSGDYIFLSKVHNDIYNLTEDTIWNQLVPLIGFEDAAALLVSQHYIGVEFLKGTWAGGGYYMTIDKKGSLSHNIPANDGNYYQILEGGFITVDEDAEFVDILWLVTVESKDKITIFEMASWTTYTLYRQ